MRPMQTKRCSLPNEIAHQYCNRRCELAQQNRLISIAMKQYESGLFGVFLFIFRFVTLNIPFHTDTYYQRDGEIKKNHL